MIWLESRPAFVLEFVTDDHESRSVLAITGGRDLASDCCFRGLDGLTKHLGNPNVSIIAAHSRGQGDLDRQCLRDVYRVIGTEFVQVFLASPRWYPRVTPRSIREKNFIDELE